MPQRQLAGSNLLYYGQEVESPMAGIPTTLYRHSPLMFAERDIGFAQGTLGSSPPLFSAPSGMILMSPPSTGTTYMMPYEYTYRSPK